MQKIQAAIARNAETPWIIRYNKKYMHIC